MDERRWLVNVRHRERLIVFISKGRRIRARARVNESGLNVIVAAVECFTASVASIRAGARVPFPVAADGMAIPVRDSIHDGDLSKHDFVQVIVDGIKGGRTRNCDDQGVLTRRAKMDRVRHRLVEASDRINDSVDEEANKGLARERVARQNARNLVVTRAVRATRVNRVSIIRRLARPKHVTNDSSNANCVRQVLNQVPVL